MPAKAQSAGPSALPVTVASIFGPPSAKEQLPRNRVHPLPEYALEDGRIEPRRDARLQAGRRLGRIEKELQVDVARRARQLQPGDEEPLAIVGDRDAELGKGGPVEGEVAPVEIGLDVGPDAVVQIEENPARHAGRPGRKGEPVQGPSQRPGKGGGRAW